MRVQQQVCALKGGEEGDDVQTARQILKEARNSRAVSGLIVLSLYKSVVYCFGTYAIESMLVLCDCVWCKAD